MNITIVSHFRNAAHYAERYFDQMQDFQNLIEKEGHSLYLILGYGDSADKTGEVIYDETLCRFDAIIRDVSHGGQHYGSIVHPERFKQLAYVGNLLWRLIPKKADYVGLVESDLIWSGATLASLLSHVEAIRSAYSDPNSPILLAPLVKHLDGRFYDTWAFRMNGENFTNAMPYHPQLLTGAAIYEMDSVGSCVFMDGDIARQLTWPEEDVFVGFCRKARELGAKIYLDKTLEVYHA